VALLSHFIVAK